jgi:hypothetical protein
MEWKCIYQTYENFFGGYLKRESVLLVTVGPASRAHYMVMCRLSGLLEKAGISSHLYFV